MDIIRSHIHQFVAIHNTHSIRQQRHREHYLPTGQPFLLYHYPDSVKDYKETVDINTLTKLEKWVEEFDLDTYLPASALRLYANFLSEGGFPTEFVYSDNSHREAYIFLQQKVADYLRDDHEISLFNTPRGAEEWINSHQRHKIDYHREHDFTMIIEDTDNEREESELESASAELENKQIKEGLSRLEVRGGESSSTNKTISSEQFWESDEEDYDDTIDGYFLDLKKLL